MKLQKELNGRACEVTEKQTEAHLYFCYDDTPFLLLYSIQNPPSHFDLGDFGFCKMGGFPLEDKLSQTYRQEN